MPPFTFPARTMSFGPFDTPGGASSKKKDRASVFVWGWGSQGQLGIGDPASRLAPVSVSTLTRHPSGVTSLACGSRFTIALTKGGAVHSFGRNEDGQLGHGDRATQLTPRLVEALTHVRVAAICARGAHVLALEADSGKVWSWGRGDEGQLGHGNTAPSSRPRPIACFGGGGSTTSDDTMLSPGDNSSRSSSSSSSASGMSGAVRAVAIACGRQHSCALDDQGQLWTWGGGEDGALGHGSHDSEHFPRVVLALLGVKIASVHCGSRHTIALPEIHATGVLEGDLSTNTAAAAALPGAAALYSWGWGAYGQLGLGDRASQPSPMILPASLFSWGGDSSSSASSSSSSSRSSPSGKGGDHSPSHSTSSGDNFNSLATHVSVVAVACGYRHTVVAVTHTRSSSSSSSSSFATSPSANAGAAVTGEGWQTPTKATRSDSAHAETDFENQNGNDSPRHSNASGSSSTSSIPRTTIWAWGWNQFGQCGQSPTNTLGVGSSGRGVLLTPQLVKPSGPVDWGAASLASSSSSSRLPAFIGAHQSVPEDPLPPPAMSLPPPQQQQQQQQQQSEYDNALPPMATTPPRSAQRVPAAAGASGEGTAAENAFQGIERHQQQQLPPSPPHLFNSSTSADSSVARAEGHSPHLKISSTPSPPPPPPSPPLDPQASPQKNMTPRQRQRRRTLSHGSDDAPNPLAVNFAFRGVPVLGAGGRHTVVSGQRWSDGMSLTLAWGRGDDGQLGLGRLTSYASAPAPVQALKGCTVTAVSCGWAHSGVVLTGQPPSRAALGGGLDPDLHEGGGGSEDHFDGDETEDESGYLFSGPDGSNGLFGRFQNGGWAAAWAAVDQEDDDDEDDDETENGNGHNEESKIIHGVGNGSNDYESVGVELTSMAANSGDGIDTESGGFVNDGEASNGYQASTTTLPQVRQRSTTPAVLFLDQQAAEATAAPAGNRGNGSTNNRGRGVHVGCLRRLLKHFRSATRRGSKRLVLLAWLVSRPWVQASKWLRMVPGDLDGLVGQLLGALIQFMITTELCGKRAGMPAAQVTTVVLPACAAAVAVGNFAFFAQARVLGAAEGRRDVTAQPHGVSTIVFFAYTLLIMGPEWRNTGSFEVAWATGLFAATLTALLELGAIPLVFALRAFVPKAALRSSVAGVAFTAVTMGFAFEVYSDPLVALAPLTLILVAYGSGTALPGRLPGSLGALGLGALLLACTGWLGLGYHGDGNDDAAEHGTSSTSEERHYDPSYTGDGRSSSNDYDGRHHSGSNNEWVVNLPSLRLDLVWQGWASGRGWKYLSVILPVTVVNISSNLAQVESAWSGGDRFSTAESMAIDALASLLGAFLGSPYPTGIYIGQPAFKAMGAHSAYMLVNGIVVIIIAAFSLTTVVFSAVPMSAGVGFLLWVGILITAQAFEQDPSAASNHSWAVALGLVPCLAAWALQLVEATVVAAAGLPLPSESDTAESATTAIMPHAMHSTTGGDHGSSSGGSGSGATTVAGANGVNLPLVMNALEKAGVHPFGMIALSQGYLLTSIVLAAAMVHIIDRRFEKAAAWMLGAAALSWCGLIHGYVLEDNAIVSSIGPPTPERWGGDYTSAYVISAGIMAFFHIRDGGDSGFGESAAAAARSAAIALRLPAVATALRNAFVAVGAALTRACCNVGAGSEDTGASGSVASSEDLIGENAPDKNNLGSISYPASKLSGKNSSHQYAPLQQNPGTARADERAGLAGGSVNSYGGTGTKE